MRFDPATDRAMAETVNRPVSRRPWLMLLNAVLTLAEGKAELVRHGERAWASVTFSGSRHTIVLAFTGDEAVAEGEAFIAALPNHEFTFPRHLVADAAVTRADHALLPEPRIEVEVELLLLDDD